MSMNILYKRLNIGHIVKLKTVNEMLHLGYNFNLIDDKLKLVDSHGHYINDDLIPLLGTNQKVFSVSNWGDTYFIKLVGESISWLICEAIDRVIGFDGDEEKYVINKDLDFEVGETVLASDSDRGWVKRIFVGYNNKTGKYMCVTSGDEYGFLKGRNFFSQQWLKIKKYILEDRKIEKKKTLMPITLGTKYINGDILCASRNLMDRPVRAVFKNVVRVPFTNDFSADMYFEIEE